MTIRLYFDEDAVRHALVEALGKRRVDVLTPMQAGMIQATDKEQLEYAATRDRALYTFNIGDFCQLHVEWVTSGKAHAGIIMARQQRYSVGEQMRRLLKLLATRSAHEMQNQIEFLSNWG